MAKRTTTDSRADPYAVSEWVSKSYLVRAVLFRRAYSAIVWEIGGALGSPIGGVAISIFQSTACRITCLLLVKVQIVPNSQSGTIYKTVLHPVDKPNEHIT